MNFIPNISLIISNYQICVQYNCKIGGNNVGYFVGFVFGFVFKTAVYQFF